jgi:hypothetical protein
MRPTLSSARFRESQVLLDIGHVKVVVAVPKDAHCADEPEKWQTILLLPRMIVASTAGVVKREG